MSIARRLPRGGVVAMLLLASVAFDASAAKPPGSFDPSFRGSGRLITETQGESGATDAFVTSSGRILVVGPSGGKNVVVLRYLPNGQLDETFGENGVKRVQFPYGPERPRVLALPGTQIFVVATVYPTGSAGDIAIAKLTPGGELESGYGDGGISVFDFGGDDRARDVLVPRRWSKFYVIGGHNDGQPSFASARFNATGSLDTDSDKNPQAHWGQDGIVITDVAGGGSALGGTVLRSGHLILVGSASGLDSIAMIRYNFQGLPDPNWHDEGIAILPAGDNVDHIERIGFGRSATFVPTIVAPEKGDRFIRVASYLFTGEVNTAFSEDGFGKIDLPGETFANALAVSAEGKPIVAAFHEASETIWPWAIVRLTRTGERDTDFARNGLRRVRFRPTADEEYAQPNDLSIQGDGRILAVGSSLLGETDSDIALARFRSGDCGQLGTPEQDSIGGTAARDVLCGGEGGDDIYGYGNDDRLLGGLGADTLNGGPGRDVCIGGPGEDFYRACEVKR